MNSHRIASAAAATESMPEAIGSRRVIRGFPQVQQNRASLHCLGAGQRIVELIVLYLNALYFRPPLREPSERPSSVALVLDLQRETGRDR
jgi:hypothetical protein